MTVTLVLPSSGISMAFSRTIFSAKAIYFAVGTLKPMGFELNL